MLEAEARHYRETLDRMAGHVERIDQRLGAVSEQFLAAISAARGGWWALVQVGAVCTLLSGGAGALAAKLLWR